ncbi:hypothetical protein FCV25MIE_28286 [Fagus crenata]
MDVGVRRFGLVWKIYKSWKNVRFIIDGECGGTGVGCDLDPPLYDSYNVQISISNSRGRGGKRRRRRRIGNGRAKRRRRLSEMDVGDTSDVVLGLFGRFTRVGRMKGVRFIFDGECGCGTEAWVVIWTLLYSHVFRKIPPFLVAQFL